MASETISVTVALLSAIFATSLSVGVGAVDPDAEHAEAAHPEAETYDAKRNATADVDAALARAKLRNVRTIIVMGANWCHDSRGLAGHLQSERFQPLIAKNYELVFVDVNVPQDGEGRNLDIASRYGVTDISGTPNVLIISPEGKLVNTAEDARSWRDAASRDADDIYAYFADL
ncbi:thioredoxin family protein [Parasphingorhabdus sp. DH2-15]|uniref:thioredoxin family protein n=1 Tax=Parasphingorhabdus sp. DH2-15 TaxID=3444112 RepID=UPI003F685713